MNDTSLIGRTLHLRRLRDRALAIGVVAAVAVAIGAMPTAAQEVPCDEIDLKVEMQANEEPECWKGYGGEGNFRTEWEAIQLVSGDRLLTVELQRVIRRGAFYRPTLEDMVEFLFWDDVVDATWGTGIDHQTYKARQVKLELDDGDTIPCFGFVEIGGGPDNGSKQVIYGLVCNLNGLAFSEGEAADIMTGIGE